MEGVVPVGMRMLEIPSKRDPPTIYSGNRATRRAMASRKRINP